MYQHDQLWSRFRSVEISQTSWKTRLISLFVASLLLQTKCFICGIGSEYFDKVPHGFETHTLQEHNLANYL